MIWNFSLATGAAVALNPIPVVDIAGGLAVDVGMIVALSKVYGIPLTRRTAASLVRDMMLALGAMGAVGVVGRLVASGIKSSLAGVTILTGGLAAPLTALGYATFGLAQAATAASTSYILGQGAKTYLRQGCQWGPRGIKTVIQQIITEAKADSVIDRLATTSRSGLKNVDNLRMYMSSMLLTIRALLVARASDRRRGLRGRHDAARARGDADAFRAVHDRQPA